MDERYQSFVALVYSSPSSSYSADWYYRLSVVCRRDDALRSGKFAESLDSAKKLCVPKELLKGFSIGSEASSPGKFPGILSDFSMDINFVDIYGRKYDTSGFDYRTLAFAAPVNDAGIIDMGRAVTKFVDADGRSVQVKPFDRNTYDTECAALMVQDANGTGYSVENMIPKMPADRARAIMKQNRFDPGCLDGLFEFFNNIDADDSYRAAIGRFLRDERMALSESTELKLASEFEKLRSVKIRKGYYADVDNKHLYSDDDYPYKNVVPEDYTASIKGKSVEEMHAYNVRLLACLYQKNFHELDIFAQGGFVLRGSASGRSAEKISSLLMNTVGPSHYPGHAVEACTVIGLSGARKGWDFSLGSNYPLKCSDEPDDIMRMQTDVLGCYGITRDEMRALSAGVTVEALLAGNNSVEMRVPASLVRATKKEGRSVVHLGMADADGASAPYHKVNMFVPSEAVRKDTKRPDMMVVSLDADAVVGISVKSADGEWTQDRMLASDVAKFNAAYMANRRRALVSASVGEMGNTEALASVEDTDCSFGS